MPYKHIFVAVHGIGEQYRFATIQAVATRIARMVGLTTSQPTPVAPQPLGHFHVWDGRSVRPLANELSQEWSDYGFAETYWAEFPREVVKQGFTLEETKAWARTVGARAQGLFQKAKAKVGTGTGELRIPPDFGLVREVLDEIIDAIHVLDNLLKLADKAGIFRFDLKKLLDAYLGDVQLVADFADKREEIVGCFHATLLKIYDEEIKGQGENGADPGPDKIKIHIVAHSEGTVVAFLGLLKALNARPEVQIEIKEKVPAWIPYIHSLMTIGSPIDKHLLLWPEMWKSLDGYRGYHERNSEYRIKWHNYYDLGDPVGFKLESAREWLGIGAGPHPVNLSPFDFPDTHENQFTRYMLPGKAHNDYWTDAELFQHYATQLGLITEADKRVEKLDSKPLAKWVSPCIPYLLSAVVLGIGCYLLSKASAAFVPDQVAQPRRNTPELTSNAYHSSKAVMACLTPQEIGSLAPNKTGTPTLILMIDTARLLALLAGTTLFARWPRLLHTRSSVRGWLAMVLGCCIYFSLFVVKQRQLDFLPYWRPCFGIVLALITALLGCSATMMPTGGKSRRERWFRRDMRPMLITGGIAIVAYIGLKLVSNPGSQHPLWPMLIGGAAFLYLWWLAALLFDLAFVWHHYIRNEGVQKALLKWHDLAGRAPASESSRQSEPAG